MYLPMSLYYEAARILEAARDNQGSIKSITFGRQDWKSDRKALFALATETAKWSSILSEVIENSDVLKIERQVSKRFALEIDNRHG